MVSKKNILIILGFFVYLLIAIRIQFNIMVMAEERYRLYPHIFLIGMIYIPAGVIMGYIKIQENLSLIGKWRFKLPQFLLFSIPSLYLLFYHYLHFTPFGIFPMFIGESLLKTNLQPLYGLIFGFGLITSFYKIKDNSSLDV